MTDMERKYPGDYEIHNRTDAVLTFLAMIRPLKPFYSSGHAWLLAGDTGVHYGRKSAAMEGFARVMWGLGPLWAGDNKGLPSEIQEEIEAWRLLYLDGIVHGTDPEHEEYWGDVGDFDQKMVEMAALVTSVSLSPGSLWEPLAKREKEHLCQWLNQINDHKVHANNWRFFRILVNMAFRTLGLPYRNDRLLEDLEIIEKCYCGEGWYFDGNPGQMDYYIPFAMHFYGLIYASFMEKTEPEYAKVLKQRGRQFSEDFLYWFSKEGEEIPYGRSLTYRFAHSAFFSAMAFASECGPGYGVMKKLVLGNLQNWLKRPIMDHSGILTIGYHYPNLLMSERYNAPGSPYWSMKAFFFLALPENHPFWTEQEASYDYEPQKLLDKPHMLVTHGADSLVWAFPAGQHCMNHGNCGQKYEKFVYSNWSGFSISRGNTLEEGAFDNTLAVSVAGENHYRMRYGAEDFSVTDEMVSVRYRITEQVRIKSTMIPCMPWHVRIHEIETDVAIDVADGGFSIGAEEPFAIKAGRENGKYTESMVKSENNSLYAEFPWGTSGLKMVTGEEAVLISSFPNTSLFYPLSMIPTVKKRLEPGRHLLINCFSEGKGQVAEKLKLSMPSVEIEADRIVVQEGERTIIMKRGQDSDESD